MGWNGEGDDGGEGEATTTTATTATTARSTYTVEPTGGSRAGAVVLEAALSRLL